MSVNVKSCAAKTRKARRHVVSRFRSVVTMEITVKDRHATLLGRARDRRLGKRRVDEAKRF